MYCYHTISLVLQRVCFECHPSCMVVQLSIWSSVMLSLETSFPSIKALRLLQDWHLCLSPSCTKSSYYSKLIYEIPKFVPEASWSRELNFLCNLMSSITCWWCFYHTIRFSSLDPCTCFHQNLKLKRWQLLIIK